MTKAIKTVSFDLWDTVLIDDSDEPKRHARGLLSKAEERRRLVHAFLERETPVEKSAVDEAYDATDAAFREAWYGQSITWSVRERLGLLLSKLERELPGAALDELILLHENMEVEISPDLVPGVAAALESLKGKYRLAVISDAIFSPGRALREILEQYGLAAYFDCFVFSDEIGRSKPDASLFEEVAKSTGCALAEIVHLGDREAKDVDGAHAVGARAVLVPIATDRGAESTRAEAVLNDYAELPAILETMETTT